MNNNKISVLVTGSNGQLGQCIQLASTKFTKLELSYKDIEEVDITKEESLFDFLKDANFDYVINCAAYTNVEHAEKEPEKAFLINAEGVNNIAKACKLYDVKLIHISTDYVFDGEKKIPYTEEDIPNPINEYGKSKLLGEQYVQEILEKHFIVRTSWLYSQFGKNFYKTILKKSETEERLVITISETGTPTNANDLAEFLLHLIDKNVEDYGFFHYSNEGEATWYDFAREIIELSGKQSSIKLDKIASYPTLAKRPRYSVLNKEKYNNSFDLMNLKWKESLKNLMVDY